MNKHVRDETYTTPRTESKRKREWRAPIFSEVRYPKLPARSTRDWSLWVRALSLDSRIEDSHFKVAVTLAEHYNLKDGRCFPSHDMLALLSGASRSTVRRALRELEGLGWIAVRRTRLFGTGRQGNNEYALALPRQIGEMLAGRSDLLAPDAQMSKPGAQIAKPDAQICEPGVHSYEPITGKLRTGNSLTRNTEHSVLTYGDADRVASLEQLYGDSREQKSGPSGQALQESARREPGDKPYTLREVELLTYALGDADKTYAGILSATAQKGLGDGCGIARNSLAPLLNDCMSLGFVSTEKRNGRDYFCMTDKGSDNHDWGEALGVEL